MDKERLDEIIEKHKAQPVGHGYIDIIVTRNNYKGFISDLVNNGYKIESISWWEWCPDESKCNYGVGGPKSNSYKGWFSELPIDVNDLNLPDDLIKDQIIFEIINAIETKTITYPDETLTFEHDKCLTPGFWLGVPDDWRNKYCD